MKLESETEQFINADTPRAVWPAYGHHCERSFWDSLSVAEQKALMEAAHEHAFRAGAALASEGEASEQVFVIQSGWIKLSVGANGREQIVAVLSSGDVVGEHTVPVGSPMPTTVTALDNVRAMVVPSDRFSNFLTKYPRAIQHIYRQQRVGRSCRYPGHDLNPERRLACLLLELTLRSGRCQGDGKCRISLPMSQSELANWANVSPDMVARCLCFWRNHGIVETGRRRVEIINAEALATVCGLTSDSQPRPKSVRAAADFAWSSLGCSIFAADVAAFGGPQRNDTDRVVIRTAMYRVLRDAFEESSIRWTACYREDRGDGVLIIVPPTVSTVLIVDPLLALLAAKLRRHNRHASDAVRMQFRVAVHVGPVFSDPEGLSGEALIQTARMLDAPVLKQALAAANADMAFITSTYVYDTIIKHGPGFIDPATYQPVEVNVKESKLPAWLHLSRNPANLQSGRSPVMPSRATNIPETRFSIGGDVRIDGDIVLGNKIELGTFTRLHSGRSNIR